MELRKNNNKYLYNSTFLRKFINNLAKKGKVQKIEKVLFTSLKSLKFKVYLNPLVLFLFLINEIKPCIVLKSLRLGSVTYQIPTPLIFRKQLFKALKLLVNLVRESKQVSSLGQKIETEFFLILQGKSLLYKVNKLLYQTASSTRSFAHYR
jgi:ribosomal protein S7